jgi:hypothetical protein
MLDSIEGALPHKVGKGFVSRGDCTPSTPTKAIAFSIVSL